MNKPLLLSLLLGILISVGSCKKPDTSAGEAQAATDQVSERVVNIRTQTVKNVCI
jgi:hypothetical protein